jgi:hypothetical protein
MYSHISIGMQLEQVLNEDEKKERFKASLARKIGKKTFWIERLLPKQGLQKKA